MLMPCTVVEYFNSHVAVRHIGGSPCWIYIAVLDDILHPALAAHTCITLSGGRNVSVTPLTIGVTVSVRNTKKHHVCLIYQTMTQVRPVPVQALFVAYALHGTQSMNISLHGEPVSQSGKAMYHHNDIMSLTLLLTEEICVMSAPYH